MREYAIITDSTSNLTKDLRDKYNVDYAYMEFLYNDKNFKADLDWNEIKPHEFYDLMRNGKKIRTTQVQYFEFKEKFTNYLKEGKDILYISCSSALSGSINSAYTVKTELLEEYEDAKIFIVDSLISCFGQGYLTMKASELRSEGKTIEEVAQYLEQNRLKVNQIATVDNLEYLKRAGRVKATSAFFGNLLGVKPIIMSDAKGQNYAFKKVKGRQNSLSYLVDYVKENIIDSEEQIIYIAHADCLDETNKIKERIEKEIPCKGIVIDYIGPIVGATVGPGTIILYFVGKEVTIVGE